MPISAKHLTLAFLLRIMKKIYLALAAIVGLATLTKAQTCGLATPDLSCTVSPAYPHTCPAVLPDGQAGQFYTTDITMWFPEQFFEPSAGLTVTMNSVEINAVSGMPFGFTYTANPTTVTPSQNEFAAIRICGTPFSAGDYTVVISITVQASAFGVSQTVNQNIPLALRINPSTQGNVAFTITNPAGCSPLASSFVTNFPSNGNPGYSYFWDLGNGFSTDQETVPPVSYTAPGPNDTFYVIEHTVAIDTIGYFLTSVQVTNVSCTDNPGNNPDAYLKIFNSLGQQVYNNSGNTIEGNPPFNFTLNVPLTNPPYIIQVWDGDGGLLGGDDNCADNSESSTAGITMLLPTTNGTVTQIGTVGGLILNYTIIHPVIEISGTDTISVSPNPVAPVVTLTPGLTFCQGDSVDLASTYAFQYQWFKGDTLLPNATAQHYYAKTAGQYHLQITNQYGCPAYSDTFKISRLALPPVPLISFNYGTGNFETDLAPPTYQLQWFYENFAFAGQTAQTCEPLFNGHYFVRAENAAGCYSYSDTIWLKNVGVNDINAIAPDIKLYPNPAFDVLTLEVSGINNQKPVVKLLDISGKVIQVKMLQNALNGSKYTESIDIAALKTGVYMLQIEAVGNIFYKKVVKM